MSADVFDGHNLGERDSAAGIQWVEARDAAGRPTAHSLQFLLWSQMSLVTT